MAKLEHYHTRFQPNGVYLVYNRSVDRKPLFTRPDNRRFFLRQLKKYVAPHIDLFGYNLPGNHFHLQLQVHRKGIWRHPDDASGIISDAFKRLFQSYAMAFNKQENRIGTLFQTPFKRVEIDDECYFTHLLWYIHGNAQLHGLVNDFRLWPHSSYPSLISERPTDLQREFVHSWFGGKEKMIAFHEGMRESVLPPYLMIEDEL